jgi:hypothetical protein
MPPLPPIANVLKVELLGTYGIAEWANIFHVQMSAALSSQADLDTFTEAFSDAFAARFLPLLSTNMETLEAKSTDLTSSTALVSNITGLTDTGAIGGNAFSAQTAVAVSWKIHRRYRGGHPRTYLCGIPIADEADTRSISQAAATAFALAGNNFIADVAAMGVGAIPTVLGAVSYRSGNAARVTPIFDTFISAACHTRLDSQRRRLGKEVV